MKEKYLTALGWAMVLAISLIVWYYLVRLALYHMQ
jgi:hypothetical protein